MTFAGTAATVPSANKTDVNKNAASNEKQRFTKKSEAIPREIKRLNCTGYNFAEGSLDYGGKLIADGVGQRRVSVVTLAAFPPPRKVQQSPRVEQ